MLIQPAITIGVDPHADTLTAAAVDSVTGALQWDVTVPNSPEGIGELTGHLNGNPVVWGIEGSGTFGRALASRLLSDGATVKEVPTRLTGRYRRRHGYAKTDRGDAIAIAHAVIAEPLGPVDTHPVAEALRLLTSRREALVGDQTRAFNRLHALLRELDPTITAGRLSRNVGFLRTLTDPTTLPEADPTSPDPYHQALITVITQEATDCLERRQRIRYLETRIATQLPPTGHALTEIQGIGVIGAATIIAHTGRIERFRSEAAYAKHAGTAPLDASSGRQQRHRLNRGGNRAINRTLHLATLTQRRHPGATRDYINRRISQGKTRNEAIRAAKRGLTKRIYRTLRNHPLT